MKQTIFIRRILGIALLIGLTSCAPKYQKSYDYVPPSSAKGQACLNYCKESKGRCDRLCSNDANVNCQDENECRRPSSCRCEQDYQACYKLCGGQVNVSQMCVANCS